jgi:hypothetical protein
LDTDRIEFKNNLLIVKYPFIVTKADESSYVLQYTSMIENNIPEQNQHNLVGPQSILNLEAQKELVDYTLRAGRKNMLKILLVTFPIVIIIMGIFIGGLFYFLGIIK